MRMCFGVCAKCWKMLTKLGVSSCRWSNRGVTRTLAPRLPTVVATVLIIMIFVGSLGGSILFTYKVGLEAKDALVNFKSHVDHSNYAETTGLNKWLEDNNVTQQLDSYVGQAYDTLMQQVCSSLSFESLMLLCWSMSGQTK